MYSFKKLIKSNQGFSLIELITVIGAFSILGIIALPTAVNASPQNTYKFTSKVSVICDAFDKEYLTIDQRNDLLIDAYISFDDNFRATKLTRIKATRNIFNRAILLDLPNKEECLRDLETYVIENIYPEL